MLSSLLIGGWTSVGSDVLNYPVAISPVVTGVRGCIDDLATNTTSQCPTAGLLLFRHHPLIRCCQHQCGYTMSLCCIGGPVMRVYGTAFVGSLRILVNGVECRIIAIYPGLVGIYCLYCPHCHSCSIK
jgi:hypothetical protein